MELVVEAANHQEYWLKADEGYEYGLAMGEKSKGGELSPSERLSGRHMDVARLAGASLNVKVAR